MSKKDGLDHTIWRDGVGNPNAVPLTDYRVTVYTSDIRGAGEGEGGRRGCDPCLLCAKGLLSLLERRQCAVGLHGERRRGVAEAGQAPQVSCLMPQRTWRMRPSDHTPLPCPTALSTGTDANVFMEMFGTKGAVGKSQLVSWPLLTFDLERALNPEHAAVVMLRVPTPASTGLRVAQTSYA